MDELVYGRDWTGTQAIWPQHPGSKPLPSLGAGLAKKKKEYIPEQRTIDVLRILKDISDEKHPVMKKDIMKHVTTTDNPQTLSDTIDEILIGINPVEYEDNDDER